VTLPISERLLNEVLADALPQAAAIRDVELRPHAGNRLGVRFRIAAASFLPPINITLVIERQPELPDSPTLVLRMERSGLLSVAGSALRFFDALPPGVMIVDDRIHINVAALLAARGLAELLEYAEQLNVSTTDGSLVLTLRGVVRDR
jgi:hypothetical protein